MQVILHRFGFSEIQAQAILNMRLQRLTGLEVDKIKAEQAELNELVEFLERILGSEEELLKQIRTELAELGARYPTKRRTEIRDSTGDFNLLDLIEDKEMVITLSVRGYIKRMSATDFREQKRGGKGMRGLKSRSEDSAMEIFMATTHSELLVFTESGVVYKLAVHQIPEAGRTAFGTPIINLLPQNSDRIVSVIVKPTKDEDVDLLFCSQKGQVKRSSFSLYQNIRSNGLIAYKCAPGDKLLSVTKAEPTQEVLIATRQGIAMRCPGSEFRSLGRNTTGVRGIKMREGHAIASMIVLDPDEQRKLLTISEKGYGKRTALGEYRLQKRGGFGIFDIKTGERNGLSVGTILVDDEDKIMLLTNKGQLIKIPVKNIRETGRNTKGVRLMNVSDGELIVSVTRVIDSEDDDVEEHLPEEGLEESLASDEASADESEALEGVEPEGPETEE